MNKQLCWFVCLNCGNKVTHICAFLSIWNIIYVWIFMNYVIHYKELHAVVLCKYTFGILRKLCNLCWSYMYVVEWNLCKFGALLLCRHDVYFVHKSFCKQLRQVGCYSSYETMLEFWHHNPCIKSCLCKLMNMARLWMIFGIIEIYD